MLSPFVYADEWVFSQAEDLLVEDFSCWRKSGKRGRLFEPFLHLRTKDGQFDIVFDGYDQVWSLLNALLRSPPRMDFNRLMKGRMENATFMGELGWFLRNSEKILCFEAVFKEVKIANSIHSVDAYSATSVRDVRCKSVCPTPSTYAHILTPSRSPEGVSWRRTAVCGSHPQLVFATEDNMLIPFISAPKSANYRPFASTHYDNTMMFIAATSDLHYHMSERNYTITSPPMRDSRGMYDRERDDYEVGIFLNAQNKLQKKKRGD